MLFDRFGAGVGRQLVFVGEEDAPPVGRRELEDAAAAWPGAALGFVELDRFSPRGSRR